MYMYVCVCMLLRDLIVKCFNIDYDDLQLLSSHYEHFSHYYQSDMLDHTSLGLPSNDEKTYSALIVYRLIDTLAKEVCEKNDHI